MLLLQFLILSTWSHVLPIFGTFCDTRQYLRRSNDFTSYYKCSPVGGGDVAPNLGVWVTQRCPNSSHFIDVRQDCLSLNRLLEEQMACQSGNQENNVQCDLFNASHSGCPESRLGGGNACDWTAEQLNVASDAYAYTQCLPQEFGSSCGRWVERKCDAGEIFNETLQICVGHAVHACGDLRVPIDSGCFENSDCASDDVCSEGFCCRHVSQIVSRLSRRRYQYVPPYPPIDQGFGPPLPAAPVYPPVAPGPAPVYPPVAPAPGPVYPPIAPAFSPPSYPSFPVPAPGPAYPRPALAAPPPPGPPPSRVIPALPNLPICPTGIAAVQFSVGAWCPTGFRGFNGGCCPVRPVFAAAPPLPPPVSAPYPYPRPAAPPIPAPLPAYRQPPPAAYPGFGNKLYDSFAPPPRSNIINPAALAALASASGPRPQFNAPPPSPVVNGAFNGFPPQAPAPVVNGAFNGFPPQAPNPALNGAFSGFPPTGPGPVTNGAFNGLPPPPAAGPSAQLAALMARTTSGALAWPSPDAMPVFPLPQGSLGSASGPVAGFQDGLLLSNPVLKQELVPPIGACPVPGALAVALCSPAGTCPPGSACYIGVCCTAPGAPLGPFAEGLPPVPVPPTPAALPVPGALCPAPVPTCGAASACFAGGCQCNSGFMSNGIQCVPPTPGLAGFSPRKHLERKMFTRRRQQSSARDEPNSVDIYAEFYPPLTNISRVCATDCTCTPEEVCHEGRCLKRLLPGEAGCTADAQCRYDCSASFCDFKTNTCHCEKGVFLFRPLGLCVHECPMGTKANSDKECELEQLMPYLGSIMRRKAVRLHACGAESVRDCGSSVVTSTAPTLEELRQQIPTPSTFSTPTPNYSWQVINITSSV